MSFWERLADVDVVFVPITNTDQPDNFWYHYQALISGATALLVGFSTALFLWWQFKQAERHHWQTLELREKLDHEDRRALHRYNILKLSIALSVLIDYCDEVTSALSDVFVNARSLNDYVFEGGRPALPLLALDDVAKAAKSAQAADAQKLGSMVRFAQIHQSRLTSLLENMQPVKRDPNLSISEANLRENILDAIVLRKMVTRVFEYARGQAEDISFDVGEYPHELMFDYHHSVVNERVDLLRDFVEERFLRAIEAYDEDFRIN